MRVFTVGLLLGLRQIQRASIWATLLIILVMMLTFLNLIAVSGVLVGLIEGAERAVRENAMGDIMITPLATEDHVLDTIPFTKNLDTYPEISAYTLRYTGAGTLEAHYQERRNFKGERDTAAVNVTGIDPDQENKVSNLKNLVVEGSYLNENDEGSILIGVYYLKRYAENFGDIFDTISDVQPGDKVRLTIGNVSKELTVKGIVESKVDQVNFAVYINQREFRRLFGRLEPNADQIAIRMVDPGKDAVIANSLRQAGLDRYGKIKTFEESLPKFLIDIKKTFGVLGTFIGSIGIVVASITIFIIIFINALSRRRHIGILKGIGIDRRAIEVAYVLQSAFYALCGSALGAVITFAVLVPYFDIHPIQFPFSEGILAVDPLSTFWKFIILFGTTLVAGLIPAWLIVRQNTLNSILGRK